MALCCCPYISGSTKHRHTELGIVGSLIGYIKSDITLHIVKQNLPAHTCQQQFSAPTTLTAHNKMESNVGTKVRKLPINLLSPSLENFARKNICDDILSRNSDEELRSLAGHLLTTVLILSEYIHIFTILYMYEWQFHQSKR